ncbi:MAG: hypothetical protein NT106_12105 [Candidatus Sumerlaeota bacterium]|nr:hypothetical protein [Candidatus Sumerlaeota bacterium]
MSILIKPEKAKDILTDLKKLYDLWNTIKGYLLMAFTNEPISPDVEGNFLDVKSHTSKYLRVVAEKIDSHQFRYDPEKISLLLRQAISVTHLRSLPIADRKTLFELWHEVYVHLSQVLGAFLFIMEGYQPLKKEKKITSIASLKKGASGARKKESNIGKVIAALVVIGTAIVIIILRSNR